MSPKQQGIIYQPIRVIIEIAKKTYSTKPKKCRVLNQQRDQGHYKVSLNHVLANLLPECDDLLLREVLGDLVVEIEVQKDLTGA